MSKYGRQHSSGNTSKGIYWILFAGVAALGIYKIVNMVRTVNKVHEIETEDIKNKNTGSYLILTDSTGREDTMLLNDYLKRYRANDSIKKPSTKDSFK
jgi:hypothetical protein